MAGRGLTQSVSVWLWDNDNNLQFLNPDSTLPSADLIGCEKNILLGLLKLGYKVDMTPAFVDPIAYIERLKWWSLHHSPLGRQRAEDY